MNLTISRKVGVIVAVTLFITLNIMLFLLITNEERAKKIKVKENVEELTTTISESLIFSMSEGITDVSPFIERTEKIENIKELRITPTDLIEDGSESKMDSEEKSVLQTKESKFYEESFNDEDICRTIKTVVADENCVNCHDANLNDPLAVISLRYSMEKDYADIASQKFEAILMALGTIIVAFIIVMIFLKRKVINDLLLSINEIKKLATGDINCKIDIKRNDEIGDLCNSVHTLINSVRNHSETADQIAKGNLNIEIQQLSDKDMLGISMLKVKENLSLLLHDITSLSLAAKEGRLDKRVAAENHLGDYQKIVFGYNETLNAIVTPIEESSVVLADMAFGDFTSRMCGNYKGDFAKLKNNINKVADSMNEALMNVAQSVFDASSASTQISSSSEEMAAGSIEQSSQTAEIAASVEQMTKTILETSKNTSSVSLAAKEAMDIAVKGKSKVENTKESIEKIVSSSGKVASIVHSLVNKSEQIGEISQVIDDIADQTNLLALNAAIEAARAGEQGRGFAVVADEVRKLAERTTKATKEIAETIKSVQTEASTANEAIQESRVMIEEGMNNTMEVSELLEMINEKSKLLTDLIVNIATASEEQSITAEEISKNIEGISAVTKQSASGTQQVAQAAENLNQLIDNLQNMINRFKLNEKKSDYTIMESGKIVKR